MVSPTAGNIGTFRNSSTYGSSYADFAQSYDPLNSYAQGAGSGSYTVRIGDTLQSIAQSIYGDGNLWYKIRTKVDNARTPNPLHPRSFVIGAYRKNF